MVTLVTEPVPCLRLTAESPGRTGAATLSVRWARPKGTDAGVDLRIGFDEGAPIESYTQEDDGSFRRRRKRLPRWIELGVSMHNLTSPRFPNRPRARHALAFVLTPNDLALWIRGVRVEMAGKALIVHRGPALLRYERVRK